MSAANSRTYAFSALVSVQRSAKSGSLMGDPVQEHYGMTEEEFVWVDSTGCQYYFLHVILTMLLVRISVFAVFSRPDSVQMHLGMTEEAPKMGPYHRNIRGQSANAGESDL